MKKQITLLFFSLSMGIFAQDFSGKATYQTKMSFKDFDEKVKSDKNSLLNDDMLKQIKEAMNKGSEKTFFLEFTKEESLYTEEEKLEQPNNTSSNITISFNSSSSGKLYKNLKENYSILESDYFNKTFLIKDTLHVSGWELSTESKQIGNYTAYKATKTVKVKHSFSEEEEEQKTDKSTDLLAMMDKKAPENLVYTAWYTPQIPIANGPDKFGGLPGLILEMHTPNMVYLCSEIILNPKKPIVVKSPKGKTISQKEYDDLMKKRLKEMNTKEGNKTIRFQTISN